MTSYLIVATYNHQTYLHFDESKRQQARDKAYELFSTNGADLPEYFTFVDAFQYFEVPQAIAGVEGSGQVTGEESDTSDLYERVRSSKPYGWVGVVPDDGKFSTLKVAMEWPDSPFCCVFDIRIFPLQGNDPIPRMEEDPNVWRDRGEKIYDDQTPAMWR